MSGSDLSSVDIQLQGETVATGVEIPDVERGSTRPLIKEFNDIAVEGNLVVDLNSQSGQPLATLSAIEVIREEIIVFDVREIRSHQGVDL